MNVLKVQIDVLRHVPMKLDITPALVALAIVWRAMHTAVMISMNVLKALVAVITHVQTLLGVTHAPVIMAIASQVTNSHVVVRDHNFFVVPFYPVSIWKILMNVLKERMVVLRHVQTELGAITVLAILAIT